MIYYLANQYFVQMFLTSRITYLFQILVFLLYHYKFQALHSSSLTFLHSYNLLMLQQVFHFSYAAFAAFDAGQRALLNLYSKLKFVLQFYDGLTLTSFHRHLYFSYQRRRSVSLTIHEDRLNEASYTEGVLLLLVAVLLSFSHVAQKYLKLKWYDQLPYNLNPLLNFEFVKEIIHH
ncbi:Uncharacterised protein [Streptococcus pneumoniae]|nr:Uncharacterised protein [Streptococcus pneumoniae]